MSKAVKARIVDFSTDAFGKIDCTFEVEYDDDSKMQARFIFSAELLEHKVVKDRVVQRKFRIDKSLFVPEKIQKSSLTKLLCWLK